jgi:hypothetical protein
MNVETLLIIGGTIATGIAVYNLTAGGAESLGQGVGIAVTEGAKGIEKAVEGTATFTATKISGLKANVADKDTLSLGQPCRQDIECGSSGVGGSPSAGHGIVGCCGGRCSLRRQNYNGKWRCKGNCKTSSTGLTGAKSRNPCKPTAEEVRYAKYQSGTTTLSLGSPCNASSDCSQTAVQGGKPGNSRSNVGCVRGACNFRRYNYKGELVDAMTCKSGKNNKESFKSSKPCAPLPVEAISTGGVLPSDFGEPLYSEKSFLSLSISNAEAKTNNVQTGFNVM